MPVFSIITVTKNNLDGFRQTKTSIEEQKFKDFEWIIIDGNSKDGTQNYLKQNVKTPHQWISKEDEGIYDAMNKGIVRSTGDYLIFMNAGDRFYDHDILGDIENAVQNEPDFIYGDSIEDSHYKRAKSHTSIRHGMFTHHQSMIYKRDILDEFRYNLAYKISSDYDLTWHFLNRSRNIEYINRPLCIFESGGISQKHVLQGRIEQFHIRREHGMSWLQASVIFLAQSALYTFRCLLPSLYWKIKAR
ncbi:MAG: glycosyltransferase [Alphaproteobacteria bacterium]|nr:glycosyltransferase [Alphaproteobacteria bacterium]